MAWSTRILPLLIAGLCALAVSNTHARIPFNSDGQPVPSLAPMLEQVTPAVVNIYTQTRVRVRNPFLDDPFFRRFFDLRAMPRERLEQSLGSGVIIDAEKGLILTNNHVIDDADDIFVTLHSGENITASVLGSDQDTDIALLQIDTEATLTALPLATQQELRVGDFVVAVGNPFGLGQTVTSGIVSALGRSGIQGLNYQNFIQTDASINPGNSGGALVNLGGHLVGINTAIFSPSGGNVGIGFAIPADVAAYITSQILEHGQVLRGRFGVQIQNIDAELANALGYDRNTGAVIVNVEKKSPAAHAGLKVGDVILQLDQRKIHNRDEFLSAEGLARIGEPVDVEYWRNGEIAQTQLKIRQAQAAKMEGTEIDARLTGASLEKLPAEVIRNERISGVWVAALQRGSRPWNLGLRPGDIIVAVERTRIDSLEDLVDALSEHPDEARLHLRRGKRSYLMHLY